MVAFGRLAKQLAYDELGRIEAVVRVLATPHDHAQLPAGNERLSDVAQRDDRARKEHRPIREYAASYGPPGTARSTSATSNRTFGRPRFSLRACSMKRSAASTPTATPVGPTRSASCAVVSPNPQPMSTIRAPLAGASRSMPRSPCAPSAVLTYGRYFTNLSNKIVSTP